MTKVTKSVFNAQTASVFADNTNEDISELDIRTKFGDISDSTAFLEEVNTFSKQQKWNKGADVVATSELPILTDGNYFDVTGGTTIATIADLGGTGAMIWLHFDSTPTLTHHVTDLVLPGGVDITAAAGDEALFINYATGDWRCVAYQRADGTALVGGDVTASSTVYDYLYIDAAAMVPSTTNGAAAGTRELVTNDVMIDYLAFDTSTDEYAQFKWKAPEQITSNPVVRFKFDMTTETGGATTLIFGMQFIIMSDDESLDQSWSTATVAGAVTMTTTNDIYMSDGACTATLTGLTAGDTVFFRVFRDVSADTHAVDGQLLGVHMQYPRDNTATTVWS